MKTRNQRDSERRKYILKTTEENLKLTRNDPQSLFAKSNKNS